MNQETTNSVVLKLIYCIGIVCLLFGQTGCTDPFRNKYTGKWIEVKWENEVISIDKNNEDYIVTYQDKRLPAIYKDRNLEVTVGGLNPKMMLDEKTDRILFLEKEYIRIEKSITSKFCGQWKYSQSGQTNYLKLSKEENGRFKFAEGWEYEGKINWSDEPMIGSGSTNLSFKEGKLFGRFSSYNFRPTHGALFDYIVSFELLSDNKLLYKLGGDLGNSEVEAIKIND